MEEDLIVLSTETGEESTRRSVQRQSTTESVVSSGTHQTRLQSCYRFMLYGFRKTRQLLVQLLNLLWRFLELHLHKVVGLTIFAASITQVSVMYWFLLLFLLLVLPVPVMNFLTYPLLTLFLGAVSISKMVYQTPLIKVSYLDFVDEENACAAESVVRVMLTSCMYRIAGSFLGCKFLRNGSRALRRNVRGCNIRVSMPRNHTHHKLCM